MDKISVVVPVYNTEKYLRRCLDSILNQTYKYLEVILVDDGSTDNSGAICDEYAGHYDWFKAIHKENAGAGLARNTGLEQITGSYVMFVDSDDYIDADLTENLYKAVKKYNVDFCKSGIREMDEKGRACSEMPCENEVYVGKEAATRLMPRFIGSSPDKKDAIWPGPYASLFVSSVILNNKIKFPSERECPSEDLFFNMEYLQKANGACTISDVGYCYQYNRDSLTHGYQSNLLGDIVKCYTLLKQRLLQWGYGKEELYRADRKLFVAVRGGGKAGEKESFKSWNETGNKKYKKDMRQSVYTGRY